jgi:hypothetical protein
VSTYQNIPTELRTPPLWVPYTNVKDPKHPEKKPRKMPWLKWRTPEDRKGFRSLDYWLGKSRPFDGVQRWVEKSEGFTFIDLDRVRNPETGDIEPWAQQLILDLNTYCEISPSGKGFRLVARATLERDFHKDPDQIEIYSGNISKLMAMTGNLYTFAGIEDRQSECDQLLARCEKREYNKETPLADDESPLPPVEPPDPTHWREVFHTGSELSTRPAVEFIEGILAEGVTGIGSHSGVGKTWVGLCIAKSLITGKPLFGQFPVKKQNVPVLYLIPEMGGSAFRKRMAALKIPMDGMFYCQTVRDGAIDLQDPFLLEAVSDMRPVVILDTAIRFLKGDEQSSSEISQAFGSKMFNLINRGAQAVIFMQHRAKGSKNIPLTLENVFRGTTDFGAMCDCAWGLENATAPEGYNKGSKEAYLKDSEGLTRLYMECVKPRDMKPADPFVIQGKPHIDETGDFKIVTDREEPPELEGDTDERIRKMARDNPKVSFGAIRDKFGVGNSRITKVLGEKKNGLWVVPVPVTGTL